MSNDPVPVAKGWEVRRWECSAEYSHEGQCDTVAWEPCATGDWVRYEDAMRHEFGKQLADAHLAKLAQVTAERDAAVAGGKFKRGDRVRKTKGSAWQGLVVGSYSTSLNPEGYNVESECHPGSVQIYPANALELVTDEVSWRGGV